jgi:hypothetical protein
LDEKVIMEHSIRIAVVMQIKLFELSV